MRKFYLLQTFSLLFLILPVLAKSQTCPGLTATFTTYESRCAATGSVKIIASGGSGTYKYKMQGPSNSNYTTTDSITGLSAGTYTLFINDILNNCTISISNVVIPGTYQDPRFTLLKQDVTCDNGNNGSIEVDGELYGRSPFSYSIVAPSPMGIGTSNSTGIFNNLIAGYYSIQMTDSCGGIQTRQITVGNYSWWIDSYPFTRTGCNEISGFIRVVDSKGNISTVSGIPGFMYAVVRAPGDTIWSSTPNFTFTLTPPQNSFDVIVKDNCGAIKKVHLTVQMTPSTSPTVTTFNYLCNSFTAQLNTINFLNPNFCLYDSANVLISCNSSGIFTGLPYGNYCMEVHDECTDTTIRRCFNAVPPPIGISNTVIISNKTCYSFTATVTGQFGLTNPDYCLYNSADSLLGCNTTGIFPNLPYAPYCIKVHDGCRDTLFTVCFEPRRPVPSLPPVITPGYVTCSVFGVIVVGDSTTNPTYCLYDSNGVVIVCNTTGIFDSIPIGNYCVTMHDDCPDTTITRCFSVGAPIVTNDMQVVISDKTCSTFTATVTSTFNSPSYCLYDSADVLIMCDSSGLFPNLPYGRYCIKAKPSCPDTTLITCFVAAPDIPSVGASVAITRVTCLDFTASISNPKNLFAPDYCLYDSSNVLISCNTTGVFNNIPFGNYCIKITDRCYDTTITRCFSKAPIAVDLFGSVSRSCTLGSVKFNLSFGGGYLPMHIVIYKPNGTVLLDTTSNNNSINIDNIPGLISSENYKIIATDNCGHQDSINLAATGSYYTHSGVVIPKCPGSSWANGSGDIKITIGTNLGSLTVRVIKKDGITLSPPRTPDVASGGVYTFTDLGPGTYIISSTENYCNKKFYDTITILPYQFPNLTRSSAYQCDVNGFSVSAIATGGVPPFSYSIIGSLPTTPAILAGPQSSPIFNINNGSNYSLIRLRALDGCGNATLGDASILPLASNGIVSTLDCFSRPTTLSVDEIFNATYAWYWKSNAASTDSIFLTNQSSYYIADVTLSDIGYYVCYLSVNSGCVNRVYDYTLTGMCSIILPVKLISFAGKTENGKNILSWKASEEIKLSRYNLERKDAQNNFSSIGITSSNPSAGEHNYSFTDVDPLPGNNIYRLKMINTDGSFSYSNQGDLKQQEKQSLYHLSKPC